MASLGTAIFAQLNGNAGVTNLKPAIVPTTAPKRKPFPHVIYEKKDSENDVAYGGNTGLVQANVSVRCIVKSTYTDKTTGIAQCDAMANAVIAAMDQQPGVWGTVTVQGCFLEDDAEDEFGDQDSEEILYLVRELTFLIWYDNA